MNTETVDQNRSVSYSIDLDNGQGDPWKSTVATPPVNRTPEPVPPVEPTLEPIQTPRQAEVIPPAESTQAIPGDVGAPAEPPADDSEINPYYYLGGALKTDGYLPDDVEVNEKIDGSSVYEGYKRKLQETLEPLIRQEIYQKLEEEGVAAQELLLARAIRSGVDVRLLSAGSTYEKYATMPDTVSDAEKIDVIKQMYIDRRFKDDEIKRQITSAETEDNIDTLFVEGKQYFAEKYNEFAENQNKVYAQKQALAEQEKKKVNDIIKNITVKGEILDEKLTPGQIREFETAIRKEEIYNINGQDFRGTEMQKFLVDFEMNPEMKFLMFKLYKFRNQTKDEIKTEVKKEVENEFLKAYETKTIASKKVDQTKQIRQQLETKKATANSIFIDLAPAPRN